MLSMLKRTAPAVPRIATTTAASFPLIFGESVSEEIPALNASKKVVVTVERIMITSPAMPSPALTIIEAMSLSPVKIAAPMPIMYIHELTAP